MVAPGACSESWPLTIQSVELNGGGTMVDLDLEWNSTFATSLCNFLSERKFMTPLKTALPQCQAVLPNPAVYRKTQ